MRLKPISYLVLGLLRMGATSGYAIKKAADAATNEFWPVSLAQVYPELARLEKQGLVVRHDDSYGQRRRAAYELTDAGEEALLTWLRSPEETPFQVRIEGMLRFFFADALPKTEQMVLAQRARQRLREYREHMYDKDLRGALEDFEKAGIRAPILAGLFGEHLLRAGEEWLAQLETQLKLEIETESRGGD